MSYRSYVGASTTTGYTNGTYSYPQTLMMLDIAAIQEMYGANYKTESGDTVYKWSATTGEMFIDGAGQGAPGGNKVFMTVWDGGGNDTYDFSNYSTNLIVDLNPGGWTTTSSVQLAYLGNGHYAAGNIANALLYHGDTASLIENTIGGSGNDRLTGNVVNNQLTGGKGNDYLDGGDGVDTAIYSGLFTNYALVQNADGTWTITDLGGLDGVDTLANIELLKFLDTSVSLGITSPPPPVPLNDGPVITSLAQSASLTEWVDQSTNEVANTAHVASGAVTYSDANTSDLHTATFIANGSGYLGTFSMNTANIDTGDSVGWSFSVLDSALDYLKSGQSLTQSYTISVDDGHGGLATQDVTVTLLGADDAAIKAAPGKSGNKKGGGAEVIEQPNGDLMAGILSNSSKIGIAGDQIALPSSDTTDLVGILGVTEYDTHLLM
jgi:VCBS repeat-containing protein